MAIRFFLNDGAIDTSLPAGMVLLDFLRREQRLPGTKEGCREGDCGACLVLLGEREGKRLRYRAVNSCLLPLGAVEGRHLVSIEGLSGPDSSTVQAAFIEQGASQCGFCTPGFVVALSAYCLGDGRLCLEGALDAVAGNICRCTGYLSIQRAIEQLLSKLTGLPDSGPERLPGLVKAKVLPQYFLDIPSRLAGGTDEARVQRTTRLAGGIDEARVQRTTRLAGGTDEARVQRTTRLAGWIDEAHARQDDPGAGRNDEAPAGEAGPPRAGRKEATPGGRAAGSPEEIPARQDDPGAGGIDKATAEQGLQLVAGGTDLFVQTPEALEDRALQFISEPRGIEIRDGQCFVGSATPLEDLRHSQALQELFPQLDRYMRLVASLPIRQRATPGGNIANASPIGDMSIFFLALDASLHLGGGKTGGGRAGAGGSRTLRLRNFFRGYKQLDLAAGERIEWVSFPLPGAAGPLPFNFEKVSRRTHLDIASVNSAALIECDGDSIKRALLSAGGVAPIPLYLAKSSEFLRGKTLAPGLVRRMLQLADSEISPIDDIRGSAAYKRLLLRQLLVGHFLTLFPGRFAPGELLPEELTLAESFPAESFPEERT